MAWWSRIFVGLALVVVPAFGQNASCESIDGLWMAQDGTEVLFHQEGCDVFGTDDGGANFSGNVTGDQLALFMPGDPPQSLTATVQLNDQQLNGTWGKIIVTMVSGVPVSNWLGLTKIPRSRHFQGFWAEVQGIDLGMSLAITVDLLSGTANVTDSMGRAASGNATLLTMLLTTETGAATDFTLVSPDTLKQEGGGWSTTWKKIGVFPCFRESDASLSPQCTSDLVGLRNSGAFIGLNTSLQKRGSDLSNVINYQCVGAEQVTQAQCPAACFWVVAGASQFCSCNDETSCVSGGFSWVTRAYPCDSGFKQQIGSAVASCCGGAPSVCDYFGVPPGGGPSPPPGPSPPSDCKSVPTATVAYFERNTGMMVRRCGPGGPGPSPYYPPPSPQYGPPSPGYYPPSPAPTYYPMPTPQYPLPTPYHPPPSPPPSYSPPAAALSAPATPSWLAPPSFFR